MVIKDSLKMHQLLKSQLKRKITVGIKRGQRQNSESIIGAKEKEQLKSANNLQSLN